MVGNPKRWFQIQLSIAITLFFVAPFLFGGDAPATVWPLWNGHESIADYATRVNLAPANTLDLGKGVKLETVLIPAGKFMMGIPATEINRLGNESSLHDVVINQPFYIGRYVVTQEQYEALIGNNPSHFKDAKNPVEQVLWNDAQVFCKKLSDKSAMIVRLPAEAEWEYACRAGTTTRFSFGDDVHLLGKYAWFSGNSDDQTHPVGKKTPNQWGVFEMHGHVWEFCEDDYPGYADATHDGRACIGNPRSGCRVYRGGCWSYNLEEPCSSSRLGLAADQSDKYHGFRVVVTAQQKVEHQSKR